MIIDNGEILYRYADPKVIPEGQDELPLSIFTDAEMSCDWERYQCSPHLSAHVSHGRNMIIAITVCDEIKNPKNPKRLDEVVEAWQQQVLHDPVQEISGDPFTPNESHSLVKGKKKIAVTTAIRNNSKFQIV